MMNQISNPGQQPGHHSAQPVAPHQQQNICFAPAQQYHGDGYDPRQQEQSYQQNVAYNHATLTLPQNSHIPTSTNSNGMTMVDVAAPPFGYDQSMIQPMQAYQYAMQYAAQNRTPYAKPQVNEVKDSSLETTTEEVNSELSRDIANCAVSAKSVSSQPHEDAEALPTKVVAEQKNDRVSLVQEYERKLDEFINSPEILEEISNKVYNRKFMQHLRDIIRDFNTTPCPLSEQELKRIGIDRATMHQPVNVSHKSKYQERRGDNKKSWRPGAQPRGDIRWPNDFRENQNINRQIKPQNTNCSPVRNQKFATLIRGPNAWLPKVMKTGNVVDPKSVEARIAKIKKDVQGILNKITPTTAADLSIEMINKCVWRDEDTLPAVIELFFTKAIGEPKYVELYSDLCSSLHKAEQNMEMENFKRHFHGAIIRKCQCSFETTALSHFQETTNKIQNAIQEEEQKDDKDEKKLTELNDRLEDLHVKEKRRMLGIIKFVSHLFRIELLNYKIIENCIVILIRNAEEDNSELMAEYAIELMKLVGQYFVQRKENTSKLDGYVTYLDKFKPTVSNRVKFMIMDLADLRDKGWVDKRDLPKNMDEIDMYIKKLAEKSRRDVIEQQQKNNANKPSIDKKDRLNAARLAASTSASAFKKDTSLLKVDQQRLGSTKNWEIANVNTNIPSANNKYLGRIIPQQSTNARQNSNDVRESAAHKENKSAIAPTPMIDSRSTSTTPPPTDPSSSRLQNNTPTVTPETEFNKGAFKTGFKERLQSFVDGTNVDEIAKSLIEFSNELNNPVVFLEQMFSYCCEHLRKTEEKERHAVSQLVVKCFQDSVLKNAFSPAFKKYCKYLVQDDIEGDVPHLKTTFPEFVARILTASNSVSLFIEGFKEFHESGNYMFARTLAKVGRILTLRNNGDVGGPLAWLFESFSNADPYYKSDEMQQILAQQTLDYDQTYKNLKELIG